MTKQEAKKAIRLEGDLKITGKPKRFAEFMDGLAVAQDALTPPTPERIAEVWGSEWEWFDEEVGNPLEGIEREWGWRCLKCKVVLPDDFDDPDNPPGMRFCPWCSAAMTPEALDIVRERLEDIQGG